MCINFFRNLGRKKKANEKVDATVQEGDVETAATGRVDNDEPKEATVNHVSFPVH